MAKKTLTKAQQLIVLLADSTLEERLEMRAAWRQWSDSNQKVELAKQVQDKMLLPGARVAWTSKYGVRVTGTLVRVNSKSCTIKNCSDGKTWRVAPSLLQQAQG